MAGRGGRTRLGAGHYPGYSVCHFPLPAGDRSEGLLAQDRWRGRARVMTGTLMARRWISILSFVAQGSVEPHRRKFPATIFADKSGLAPRFTGLPYYLSKFDKFDPRN